MDDVEVGDRQFAQHDRRMRREEILPGFVFFQVLEEPRDSVRLKPDFDFVEERNVGRLQRFLLKAGRQHTLRAKPELAERHVAIVQREAADAQIQRVVIKMRLVFRVDVDAQGNCGLLRERRDFVEAAEFFRALRFERRLGGASGVGQRRRHAPRRRHP